MCNDVKRICEYAFLWSSITNFLFPLMEDDCKTTTKISQYLDHVWMLLSLSLHFNTCSFSASYFTRSSSSYCYTIVGTYMMLMTTPRAETIIIVSASTSKSIEMTLWTAANTRIPVMTQMMRTLTTAPSTSVGWKDGKEEWDNMEIIKKKKNLFSLCHHDHA